MDLTIIQKEKENEISELDRDLVFDPVFSFLRPVRAWHGDSRHHPGASCPGGRHLYPDRQIEIAECIQPLHERGCMHLRETCQHLSHRPGILPAGLVLDAPPGREDRVCQPPFQEALTLETELLMQDVDPPLRDLLKIGFVSQFSPRVHQQRTHLIAGWANHPLWVDDQPSAP